jgi:L-seryl-tRNA(Ser) seleniumtransferase
VLERIRKNPLTRALRIDKLTLAALESVLRLYRDPQTALSAIPTLAMITCPLSEVQRKADHLVALLRALDDRRLEIEVLEISSRVGGGALPMQTLPSQGIGLGIQGLSANAVEKQMREHCPPVIGRIENERFVMDLRTVKADELAIIAEHTEDILKS